MHPSCTPPRSAFWHDTETQLRSSHFLDKPLVHTATSQSPSVGTALSESLVTMYPVHVLFCATTMLGGNESSLDIIYFAKHVRGKIKPRHLTDSREPLRLCVSESSVTLLMRAGHSYFSHIFIMRSSSTRPFSRPAAPLWWARGRVGSNPHCALCTMASLKMCGIVLHTRCQVCACPTSSQVNGSCLGSLFSSIFQYCCFLKWFVYLYNLHGKYIYIFFFSHPFIHFAYVWPRTHAMESTWK